TRTMPRFKLVFFVPVASTQHVLGRLFERFPRNVGRIGAYGGCAFVSRGTGQFTPLDGAHPAIGEVGRPERVEEDRVEVVVQADSEADLSDAGLREGQRVHPYEEVAYDVYRLEDF
ncbi:GTP cyclohydrolase 1 type 2/Nif3, partial [Fomitopsis serialis]|uniref:GTP cyclohydrolase 1 type 2/Nif3 n=1 Tax=Fomitopsis serialis TaxID=139415 RepID=UPI0020072AFC